MRDLKHTTEQQKHEAIEKDYETIADMVYSHVSGSNWRNVRFTSSGVARFAATAGWIVGLHQSGKQEMAKTLAHDLLESIRRLERCGETTFTVGVLEVVVPSRKTILSDDGTFGGFAVGWYTPIHPTKYKASYTEAYERLRNAFPDEDDFWYLQKRAETEVRQQYKLRGSEDGIDLKETKYFWEEANKALGPERVGVEYGYSYCGGLLYHGPMKGQNYAVTIGKVRSWSIHT